MRPGERNFSPADVAKVIANPIYAGIGPYPAIVPETQWIEACAKLIEEKGAKIVLKELLDNLRAAFPAD